MFFLTFNITIVGFFASCTSQKLFLCRIAVRTTFYDLNIDWFILRACCSLIWFHYFFWIINFKFPKIEITFKLKLLKFNDIKPKEKILLELKLKNKGDPGIEPGTSCTRNKNHTTRPIAPPIFNDCH